MISSYLATSLIILFILKYFKNMNIFNFIGVNPSMYTDNTKKLLNTGIWVEIIKHIKIYIIHYIPLILIVFSKAKKKINIIIILTLILIIGRIVLNVIIYGNAKGTAHTNAINTSLLFANLILIYRFYLADISRVKKVLLSVSLIIVILNTTKSIYRVDLRSQYSKTFFNLISLNSPFSKLKEHDLEIREMYNLTSRKNIHLKSYNIHQDGTIYPFILDRSAAPYYSYKRLDDSFLKNADYIVLKKDFTDPRYLNIIQKSHLLKFSGQYYKMYESKRFK